MGSDSDWGGSMSEDEGSYGSDVDASGDDSDYEMPAEEENLGPKVPYKVLVRSELTAKQQQAFNKVMAVLEISEDAAMRVLRKYKWDTGRAQEEWFSKYDQVRESLGLVDEPATSSGRTEEECLICFERYPLGEMRCATCKQHFFCKSCWKGYISSAIGDGMACLELRCPATDCKAKAVVPSALVLELATPDEAAKYREFMLRTFVEDNATMCWCPGKNCDRGVECLVDRGPQEALDVKCDCGTAFCFNCKEEAHRPVACETVTKWLTKNSAESENMNWILANTKPCPKCSRPIEKNQGCMHMTCSQCRFEFCWLCQGDWKEHGERTGGYYACNRFETAKKKGDFDEDSRRRENAKASLERYMHYFERYDAHSKAREKARSDAGKVNKEWLDHLADITKTPNTQLRFINAAWDQIVECRRQLKWTYAYGYYAFENADRDAEVQNQKVFFEFLQGDAERSLERLHEAAERVLGQHVQKAREKPQQFDVAAFQDFRKNLIGLTDVTSGFFDKLVKQLEKGFSSMESDYTLMEEDDAAAGPSTSAAGAKAKTPKGGRNSKKARGQSDDLDSLLAEQGFWTCTACTYNVTDLAAKTCPVCSKPRPAASRSGSGALRR